MRPAAPASPARDTILVVEDQEPVAALLNCILERSGFRVLCAPTGAVGLKLFSAEPGRFALALLDATLPDIHGGALGRQLRFLVAGLPVLFVTGRDVAKLRETFAADGPTGIVAKPFLPGEVVRAVRALTGATA